MRADCCWVQCSSKTHNHEILRWLRATSLFSFCTVHAVGSEDCMSGHFLTCSVCLAAPSCFCQKCKHFLKQIYPRCEITWDTHTNTNHEATCVFVFRNPSWLKRSPPPVTGASVTPKRQQQKSRWRRRFLLSSCECAFWAHVRHTFSL